jgi:hypothetical protein
LAVLYDRADKLVRDGQYFSAQIAYVTRLALAALSEPRSLIDRIAAHLQIEDPDLARKAAETAEAKLLARVAQLNLDSRVLSDRVVKYLFDKEQGFDEQVDGYVTEIADKLQAIQSTIRSYSASSPDIATRLARTYDDYLPNIDPKQHIVREFLEKAAPTPAESGTDMVSVDIAGARVTSALPLCIQRSPMLRDTTSTFKELGFTWPIDCRKVDVENAGFDVGVNVTIDSAAGDASGWRVGIVQYAKGDREANYPDVGTLKRSFAPMQDGNTFWYSGSDKSPTLGSPTFVYASDRPYWAAPLNMGNQRLGDIRIGDEFQTYVVVRSPGNDERILYCVEWRFVVDPGGARYERTAIRKAPADTWLKPGGSANPNAPVIPNTTLQTDQWSPVPH